MKMDIDVNHIVKNAVYENVITSSIVKNIKEFGAFDYFIYADKKKVTFAFSCKDFDKIYDFSGKEWIEKEFSE